MIQTLTHRGLEPDKKNFFAESSYEAFAEQASRGFGLEFDLYFTPKNKILISHDGQGGNCDLEKLLGLIRHSPAQINALHLKGKFQTRNHLDLLLEVLKKNPDLIGKVIIFDVKINTAKYLKDQIQGIKLAPSVAHHFDIKRYNQAVKGTLMILDEALDHQELFDWIWLDEWDRTDKNDRVKSLYNEDVVTKIHSRGLKVAIVSPELHATSPNLLGGESHQDSIDRKKLTERLREIILLKPDAICTDYPELVKDLLEKI